VEEVVEASGDCPTALGSHSQRFALPPTLNRAAYRISLADAGDGDDVQDIVKAAAVVGGSSLPGHASRARIVRIPRDSKVERTKTVSALDGARSAWSTEVAKGRRRAPVWRRSG
jgi:hypothetical protein